MFSQISETHHTKSYVEASDGKPDNRQPTRKDGAGRRVGATCCPNKVGSSGCSLHRALEGLILLGVGHTGSSVVRSPHAFLQRTVRDPYVVCTYSRRRFSQVHINFNEKNYQSRLTSRICGSEALSRVSVISLTLEVCSCGSDILKIMLFSFMIIPVVKL